MEIKIPKTKAQKDFETNIQYLINVVSELTKEDLQKVLDFAVFLANE